MAKISGANAIVTLDGEDLSDWVNNTEFPVESETYDATTYGSGGYKEYVGGLKGGGTITISGLFDAATGGPQDVLEPLVGESPVLFTWQENAVAGSLKRTCSVIVQNYTESTPVGGLITFSADLQQTGAITRSVVS